MSAYITYHSATIIPLSPSSYPPFYCPRFACILLLVCCLELLRDFLLELLELKQAPLTRPLATGLRDQIDMSVQVMAASHTSQTAHSLHMQEQQPTTDIQNHEPYSPSSALNSKPGEKASFTPAGTSPPSSSLAPSTPFETLLSHVRKVPRTLKGLSLGFFSRTSRKGSNSKTAHKKTRIKPEDLFESDMSFEEDDDFLGFNSYVPIPKRYSKNVDLRGYHLPISSERKRRYSASNKNTTVLTTQAQPKPGDPAGCLSFMHGHGDGTSVPDPAAPPASTPQHLKSNTPALNVESVCTPKEPTPREETPTLPSTLALPVPASLNPTPSNEEIDSFEEEDSEEELEERINPGYKAWKKQRRAWTRGQDKAVPKESLVQNMSEAERVLVYKHLVLHCRKVREPIPLSDLLVVLNSGWAATGQ